MKLYETSHYTPNVRSSPSRDSKRFFPPVGGSQKFFWKSLTLVDKGKKLFKETIGSSIFLGVFRGLMFGL